MRDTKDMTPAQLMRCGKQRLVREITRLRLENAVRADNAQAIGPRTTEEIELHESAQPVTRAELEACMEAVGDSYGRQAVALLKEVMTPYIERLRRLEVDAKASSAKASFFGRIFG